MKQLHVPGIHRFKPTFAVFKLKSQTLLVYKPEMLYNIDIFLFFFKIFIGPSFIFFFKISIGSLFYMSEN